MISWLQTNLQKHFRVLFIVLLVVIIVAFVFTVGNQGPIGGSQDARTASLAFYDTPLNTENLRQRFQNDAQLSATLNGNMQPSQQLPFERATALFIANQHKLPEPNDAELEDFLKSRPLFQGQNGQFDPQAYNMIVDSIRLGGRATEADIRRVLVDDYRIEKVYSVLEGPGFVQESEILETLGQRLAKWSVLVATVDLNAYTPEIEVTEEMLRQHYEDFGFTYQTPVRRSVEYVEFPASHYIDEVKPTEDQLITYFEQNIERYQPEAPPAPEGEAPLETTPVTFEQVRPAVRSQYRLEIARDIAMERAHDLVVEIVENDFERGSDGLQAAIGDLGASLKSTSHFARNETPIGTDWGRNVAEAAFRLTPDRFYSDPLQVGGRAVVLFLKDEIASIVPAFETLRDRIATDVRAEKLREARSAYAVELQANLEAAADSEDSFGAAAEEAGLEVTAYQDFSLSDPAEGLNRQLLGSILGLEAQQVSDLARLGQENQGAFVYVVSKDVPEVSPQDEQYAQTQQSLKDAYARFSAQQYIGQLMQAEQARLGLLD